MKWYKKQLDKILAKTSEPTAKPSKKAHPAKNTFKKSFTSPVAARNRNRPKTDAIS